MKGSLTLTLRGPWGEIESYCIGLDELIIQEIGKINPPLQDPISGTFNEVVEILKRKEFRKDLFVREATRLGHLLAARMEDKEGWHGIERQERLAASPREEAT